MFHFLAKNLKTIGLFGIIFSALYSAGLAFDNYLSEIWKYVGYFFIIIRKSAELFEFIIDLPTLFTTTGIILSAWGLYWSIYGVVYLVNYFKKD